MKFQTSSWMEEDRASLSLEYVLLVAATIALATYVLGVFYDDLGQYLLSFKEEKM